MSNNSVLEITMNNDIRNESEPNEISYTPPLPNFDQDQDRSASPPPNCPICLTPCLIYSTTDVCSHRFCFECIKKWATVKNECPLCKKRFRSIRYNIESDTVYSVFNVSNIQRGHLLTDSFLDQLNFPDSPSEFLSIDYIPRYIYSTTFRVNEREQQTLHDYFLRNPSVRFVDFNVGGTQSQGHVHRVYNRYSSVSTTNFRRSIYLFNWWSLPFDGSVSSVSVEDYTANSEYEEKLRPWMNRETVALFGGDVPLQSQFLDDVYSALRRYSVMTREFIAFVEQYLQHRSYHFVHELHVFLRSGLDIQGYDIRIRFTDTPADFLRIITSIYRDDLPFPIDNSDNLLRARIQRSLEIFRSSPIRIDPSPYPSNVFTSPELVIIDSDSEFERTPRRRNRGGIGLFRGLRRRTEGSQSPVEVIELLSDNDSDSDSSISTTSIHYRSSGTFESMRTSGTGTCGSPILIESSSDENDHVQMDLSNTLTDDFEDIISIHLDTNTYTTTTTTITTTITPSGLDRAAITTTTETTGDLTEITGPITLSTIVSLPSSSSTTTTTTISNSNTVTTTIGNNDDSFSCTASTSHGYHDDTNTTSRPLGLWTSIISPSRSISSSTDSLFNDDSLLSPPRSLSSMESLSSSSSSSSSTWSASLSESSDSESANFFKMIKTQNKRKRKNKKMFASGSKKRNTKRRKTSRK